MELTVKRRSFTSQSTQGELSINGEFECYTLEPVVRTDDIKPRAIPLGRYQLKLAMSHKFNMRTPWLQNVPDFTDVEIHPGNYPEDTDACTLVGQTCGVNYVGFSRAAFKALMNKLELVTEDIFITYVGQSAAVIGAGNESRTND